MEAAAATPVPPPAAAAAAAQESEENPLPRRKRTLPPGPHAVMPTSDLAALNEQVAVAQAGHRRDLESLQDTWQRALSHARKENQDYRRQIDQLYQSLEVETQARLRAEQVCHQREAERDALVAQLQMQSQVHGSDDSLRQRLRTAELERAIAQDKAALLEVEVQALRATAGHPPTLEHAESKLRGEISQLQNTQVSELQLRVDALEAIRQQLEQQRDAAHTRLHQAERTLEQVSAQAGQDLADHDDLSRRNDALARELKNAQTDNETLREQVAQLRHLAPSSSSASASRGSLVPPYASAASANTVRDLQAQLEELEGHLELALDQRDLAMKRAGELMQEISREKLAAADALAQEQRRAQEVERAHEAASRQRRSQATASRRFEAARLSGLDALAGLQGENRRLHEQLRHMAQRQADFESAVHRVPKTVVATPRAAETIALLRGKDQEVAVARESARILASFVEQLLGYCQGRRVADGNVIAHGASKALELAEDPMLALPEHWERRTTDFGLTFYVDHATQSSSWVNPNCTTSAGDTFGQDPYLPYSAPAEAEDPTIEEFASLMASASEDTPAGTTVLTDLRGVSQQKPPNTARRPHHLRYTLGPTPSGNGADLRGAGLGPSASVISASASSTTREDADSSTMAKLAKVRQRRHRDLNH